MNKKIVFCGGGNMAEGILRGLLNHKTAAPENITVNELLPARCKYLSETYGVTAVTDASEAIRAAGLVIIAVNPPQVPAVAATLKTLTGEQTVIMSIAAGVAIETLEAHAGSDKKIARVMPNTLSLSDNGYSAVCLNSLCRDEDRAAVEEILQSLGQILHLREDMFNTFTGFSCTGPLWLYKMVEALTDAGVYVGFSRAVARDIVIKNMLGVAGVLDITGEHPAVKVDQMTSPGGTTIEGLRVLQQGGFSTVLMDTVAACVEKANSFE